jgi:translation initiation factor IF-1
MANEDLIDQDGEVIDVQRERFIVKTDNGALVTAYLSGRQKINKIRVIQGDRVKIQVSPYDLSKGRIVYRY